MLLSYAWRKLVPATGAGVLLAIFVLAAQTAFAALNGQ
jgi:hypothetical protein